MEKVYRMYGIEGLRRGYVYNVIIVMYYVHKLVSKLLEINKKLKIVIASDHGEFLGEKGLYDHTPRGKNEPLQRVVPWFVVTSAKDIINLVMPIRYSKHANDCIKKVVKSFVLKEKIKALRRRYFQ